MSTAMASSSSRTRNICVKNTDTVTHAEFILNTIIMYYHLLWKDDFRFHETRRKKKSCSFVYPEEWINFRHQSCDICTVKFWNNNPLHYNCDQLFSTTTDVSKPQTRNWFERDICITWNLKLIYVLIILENIYQISCYIIVIVY
jgi:hypothetical protein